LKIALLLVILALAAPSATAFVLVPALPQEGPDVPTTTAPIATVTVLDHENYSFTAGWRGRAIDVPQAPFDRVVLTWHQAPDRDPWDRTFAASVGGVEVLRGTTPRAEFNVTKDITRYAALFPRGGQVTVEGYADSWVGGAGQIVTLTISFYRDPATSALVAPPARQVVGVDRFQPMCIGTSAPPVDVTFGHAKPHDATVEFYLSGHGDQEFWWLFPESPPTFTLLVDGQAIATVAAQPASYAFVGTGQADGTQGPTDEAIASAVWWTAPQALDVVGVHTGVGELPAYVAHVPPDALPLLRGGPHTAQLVLADDALGFASGSCVWYASAAILTD
jgi:hypothetical protein